MNDEQIEQLAQRVAKLIINNLHEGLMLDIQPDEEEDLLAELAKCMTLDRKSTRLNSSHQIKTDAVVSLEKKKKIKKQKKIKSNKQIETTQKQQTTRPKKQNK